MNAITGRSAFLTLLEDEGVRHLFGNPGTTELPIMDALGAHPDIDYIMGLQESIVVAMADGFGRASGELAACNVHVAPGLGNALGALYNASWFGSPVLITAGQQEQGHGLTEPLLYGPLVDMAAPLVKWAVEVTRLADLPRIVRRAAKIATSAPTGPVFISLPGDILNDRAELDLGRRTRVDTRVVPTEEALSSLTARLLSASRPVIVCGHEVATADALSEAARFAEVLGAPVYQQTTPYGAHFPSEHPAFMGALTRDQAQVRRVLSAYDLMVCVGTDVLRMSVASEVDPLPRGMPIVQIGLDDWEMGKNYPAEIALRANLKDTLRALSTRLAAERDAADAQQRLRNFATDNWSSKRARLRQELQNTESTVPIEPTQLMLHLVDALPAETIVVEESIVTGRALLSLLALRRSDDFFGLASGGIGFAIAGAIGIHLARPARPIVALIGDGSAMYSIQALWTAAHYRLPITYLIANNRSYRILKERLLAFHGNRNFVGMDLREPEIDFVGLATALGVAAERVTELEQLAPALAKAFSRNAPSLIDIIVADGF